MIIKQMFLVNNIEITEKWFYSRLTYEIEIFLVNMGMDLKSTKDILINYMKKDRFSDVINEYEFTKQTIYIRY